jgi:hypothetical protein
MGQREDRKLSAVVVELIVVWEKVKSEIHALLTPKQGGAAAESSGRNRGAYSEFAQRLDRGPLGNHPPSVLRLRARPNPALTQQPLDLLWPELYAAPKVGPCSKARSLVMAQIKGISTGGGFS